MKQIYLVRHGEYYNPRHILPGRLPVSLSDVGNTQVEKLATFFQGKSIEVIYSSAVLRCKQTSETISKGKIPIKFDQRLLETHSAYQGYWFDQGEKLDWFHFFDHIEDLGGETMKQIQERVLSLWNEIIKRKEQNIIICSHGDVLDALYETLSNIPLREDSSEFSEYSQTQASIREVVIDDSGEVEIEPMIRNEELE